MSQALSSCHFLSEIGPEYVLIWQQSNKTDDDGRWCSGRYCNGCQQHNKTGGTENMAVVKELTITNKAT